MPPKPDNHVVIEIPQPVLILRRIDQPQRRLDPDLFKIGNERVQNALLRRALRNQDLEGEGHAVLGHHPVRERPARIPKQLQPIPEIRPVVAGSVRRGRLVLRSEDLRWELIHQRFEQLEFIRTRQTAGGEIRVLEEALGPLVGVVHQGLVDPLEIERIDDRLAHRAVLKNRLADVERQALHSCGEIVRDHLLDHHAILKCRKLVSGGPALG